MEKTSKTVLITGGASGLGKEITIEFAKKGYTVIFTYFKTNPKYIEEELDKINSKYLGIYCDLKDKESIEKMLIKALEYSKVDILINNAAVEFNTEFNDKTKEDFLETLEVNLIAPFLISREIGNNMYKNKKGVIINISSNNALEMYDPISLEYDASKKALISLSNNLAKQFSPYVRVNCIAPGFIKTEKTIKLNEELNGEFFKYVENKTLLREIPNKKDICNVLLFLASDESKFINNEVIRVDGGNL